MNISFAYANVPDLLDYVYLQRTVAWSGGMLFLLFGLYALLSGP